MGVGIHRCATAGRNVLEGYACFGGAYTHRTAAAVIGFPNLSSRTGISRSDPGGEIADSIMEYPFINMYVTGDDKIRAPAIKVPLHIGRVAVNSSRVGRLVKHDNLPGG